LCGSAQCGKPLAYRSGHSSFSLHPEAHEVIYEALIEVKGF